MSASTAAPQLGFTSSDGGFPVDIDPAADLGRKPVVDNPFFADSIYVAGQVVAPGREFGFLVHLLVIPNQGMIRQTLSITDKVSGDYRTHIAFIAPDDLTWSADRLDIRAPDLAWTGDARQQQVTTTAEWGSLTLDLAIEGPTLFYGGTGSWDMLGQRQRQRQYAFPQIAVTGELTMDGVTHELSGTSWLDRQWGGLPDLSTNHWSWMNFVLPDGDKLVVWDIRPTEGADLGTGLSWAQLLHADGSQELAAMVPLAEDSGRPWTSPVTGKVYPTELVVRIPSFGAELHVATTTLAQELPSANGAALYEGVARFTGSYRGVDVAGDIYVEHAGSW